MAARVGDGSAAFGAPDGQTFRLPAAVATIPNRRRVIEAFMISIPNSTREYEGIGGHRQQPSHKRQSGTGRRPPEDGIQRTAKIGKRKGREAEGDTMRSGRYLDRAE
jgi:hypothetical protein